MREGFTFSLLCPILSVGIQVFTVGSLFVLRWGGGGGGGARGVVSSLF